MKFEKPRYKSDVMSRFTTWLLGEMNDRHMKRKELAAALGLDHSTISYKIDGKHWKPDQMQDVFKLFEADADTIFYIMRGRER